MQKDANGPIGGREHLTFHESPPIPFECMRKKRVTPFALSNLGRVSKVQRCAYDGMLTKNHQSPSTWSLNELDYKKMRLRLRDRKKRGMLTGTQSFELFRLYGGSTLSLQLKFPEESPYTCGYAQNSARLCRFIYLEIRAA